jgi:hypothetical protein
MVKVPSLAAYLDDAEHRLDRLFAQRIHRAARRAAQFVHHALKRRRIFCARRRLRKALAPVRAVVLLSPADVN